MNGPLEKKMGDVIVCDKVCQGGRPLLASSPGTRVNLPWLTKLPGRRFMTVQVFLEDLSLGS